MNSELNLHPFYLDNVSLYLRKKILSFLGHSLRLYSSKNNRNVVLTQSATVTIGLRFPKKKKKKSRRGQFERRTRLVITLNDPRKKKKKKKHSPRQLKHRRAHNKNE